MPKRRAPFDEDAYTIFTNAKIPYCAIDRAAQGVDDWQTTCKLFGCPYNSQSARQGGIRAPNANAILRRRQQPNTAKSPMGRRRHAPARSVPMQSVMRSFNAETIEALGSSMVMHLRWLAKGRDCLLMPSSYQSQNVAHTANGSKRFHLVYLP